MLASFSFYFTLEKSYAQTNAKIMDQLLFEDNTTIIDVAYDEQTDFVFAITSDNRLLYINTVGLKVEHELSLNLTPSSIKVYDGNIYITSGAEKKVAVASTTFNGKMKEITLNGQPLQIELGGNKLFYVSKQNFKETVWSYSLDTGRTSEIGTYTNPELLFDHSQNLLYINDNVMNRVKLMIIDFEQNTINSQVMAELPGDANVRYPMTLLGRYLYLGKYELDVLKDYKVIRDDISSQILESSDDYVIVNDFDIYQTIEPYSSGKIKEYINEPIRNVKILKNGRILIVTLYTSRMYIYSIHDLVKLNLESYIDDFISMHDMQSDYYPPDIGDHWASESLDDFVSADLLKGIKDQNGNVLVYPNKTITRAEFTALLVRALDLKQPVGTPKLFKDVKPGDWYYNAVQIGSSYGFVGGFDDGRFLPNEEVKRDQIASMIVRAFASNIKFGTGTPKTFTDVPNYWAKKAITDASALGIVVGKTASEFKPNLSATRAEAVVMLDRALHKETINMPTNSELVNVVLDYRSKLDQALVEKDLLKTQTIIDNYTMGFYNEYSQIQFDFYKYAIAQGIDVTQQIKGELQAVVIEASPRFAAVELTGGNYASVYEKDGLQRTIASDIGGILSLRKMEDGSWKIYNLYVNETPTENRVF